MIMRKDYIEPQTEAMEMQPESMLCESGVINGEATEPGMVRFFDDEDLNEE